MTTGNIPPGYPRREESAPVEMIGYVSPRLMLVAVEHCTICGQLHQQVIFRELPEPSPDPNGGAPYPFWGLCPSKGELLLMRDA